MSTTAHPGFDESKPFTIFYSSFTVYYPFTINHVAAAIHGKRIAVGAWKVVNGKRPKTVGSVEAYDYFPVVWFG
jgi:hypothetical protein